MDVTFHGDHVEKGDRRIVIQITPPSQYRRMSCFGQPFDNCDVSKPIILL